MLAYLISDLPSAEQVLPYLREIDRTRRHTNAGPLLDRFEQRVGALIGGVPPRGAVGAASGTRAIEIGLRALGLPAGAAVLTPSLTFPATALAILDAGLRPVFADVDEMSWLLTPQTAEAALASSDIAAVVPVSAYGRPVSAAAWGDFAERTGRPVLVDGCGALGRQEFDPRIAIAFSLHATKPVGIGEGGMLVTADSDQAALARRLVNFGFAGGVSATRGTNAKLSEYAAAVGLAQLDRWSGLSTRRTVLFAAYRAALACTSVSIQQDDAPGAPSTFVIRAAGDAITLAERLKALGIETRRSYLPALHHHPAFADVQRLDLQVTERLEPHLLALPFHSFVTSEQAASVARLVCELSRGDHVRAAG